MVNKMTLIFSFYHSRLVLSCPTFFSPSPPLPSAPPALGKADRRALLHGTPNRDYLSLLHG